MSEHTKGELTYSLAAETHEPATLYVVQDGEDIDIADFEKWGKGAVEQKANAKRLALCWNTHDTLTQQRDDLLAVCESFVEDFAPNMTESERKAFPHCAKKYDAAESAIAKCK